MAQSYEVLAYYDGRSRTGGGEGMLSAIIPVPNTTPSPESGGSSGHEYNTHVSRQSHREQRVSSTTSDVGLGGLDVDPDVAANYHTETIDFPDSPKHAKQINRIARTAQGLPLDEESYEDADQQDEAFRAVLSPGSEEVPARKVITTKNLTFKLGNSSEESFNLSDATLDSSLLELSSEQSENNRSPKPLDFHYGHFRNNSGTAKMELTFELGGEQSRKVDTHDESSAMFSIHDIYIDDSLASLQNKVIEMKSESVIMESPQSFGSSDKKASTPTDEPRSNDITTNQINEDDFSIIIKSDDASSCIDPSTIEKLMYCFDSEKIKDIYSLCVKLQDLLSPDEIDDILKNQEAYSSYVPAHVMEALSQSQKQSSIESNSPEKGVTLRRVIHCNREEINKSIIESEAAINVTFEVPTSPEVVNNSANKSIGELDLPEIGEGTLGRSRGSRIKGFFKESPLIEPSKKVIRLNSTIAEVSREDTVSSFDDSALSESSGNDGQGLNNSPLSVPKEKEDNPAENSVPQINGDKTPIRPERPTNLATGKKRRKRILVNPDILDGETDDGDRQSLSSISNKSDGDVTSPADDLVTPDDIETPDDLDDLELKYGKSSEPIPELSAAEELEEERSWRTCVIAGVQKKIDLKVIEPYKKVLSHAGYGSARNAIIIFSACHLPHHGRKDYDYVMDHLFLYVLTSLDQLVAEDYALVYLHGATDRSNMPTFGWLKKCYQMIDRRLRKNLKGLYLVHPTFWLKTIVLMTKPFVSSKFSRKLKFVYSLQELQEILPVESVCIPEKVKQLDFQLMIKEKKKKAKGNRWF